METTEIKKHLIDQYLIRFPEEAAVLLNELPAKEGLHYLQNLPIGQSKELLLRMQGDTASEIIRSMDNDLFIESFQAIDAYPAARMISRLDEVEAKKKLSLLPEKLRNEIIELLTYPAESAGFLMDTQINTFSPGNTVSEVLEKLRGMGDKRIHNIYVVNEEGVLQGRVTLQIIALSDPDESLKNLMQDSPSVHLVSPQEEVVELLKDGKIISLPVVDLDNKLMGIIRHDSLLKAAQSDATEDALAMFGAGREERALSKVSLAVKKRLPWLEINLATAFLAASVVGAFEDTIAKITVLAVFLPVVAGQSGNTGSQALAVTIRGLALREIRVGQWFRVAKKEAAVGFINGVVVALTTSVIVFFWASSFGLAIVIGTSMVFSMVIAGFSGAVIPILLQSIGQDPAQSSSIVLTTVTDIVGFLSFLGLATALGTMLGIF
ncbi:MAG: magnesium transporter [Cyclobacteriaceae bacterium]